MSNDSISHIILNILEQTKATTISIGPTEGHFLSHKQFVVLQDCAHKLAGSALSVRAGTPVSSSSSDSDNVENAIQSRELQISRGLSIKRLQLTTASPEDCIAINLEIEQLLSQRARLDELVKQFEKDINL